MTRGTRLAVVQLEDRVTPVLGGFDVPFGADTDAVIGATDLTGVVDYANSGTGALVDRGAIVVGSRHILTAAHVAPKPGDLVTFYMRLPDGQLQQIQIPVESVWIHPDWTGLTTDNKGDVAIATLESVAPFGASDYPLYTAAQANLVTEVGQPFIMAGYGFSGTGVSGQADRELQRMTITATGGSFFLVRPDTGAQSSVAIPAVPTALDIQNALSTIGLPGAQVRPGAGPFTNSWEILFNTGANLPRLQFRSNPSSPLVNGSNLGNVQFVTLSNGLFNVEEQRVNIAAAGGVYRLGFNGNFTNPIPFNATPAQIQTELEAVPGVGEVTVRLVTTGPDLGSFEIVFDQQAVDIPQLLVDTSGLAGIAGVNTIMDGGRRLLRVGMNEYDSVVTRTLRSDFDSDGSDDFEGQGDSGSAGFIDTGGGKLAIASVVSYGGFVFGDMEFNTRVSQYSTDIQQQLDQPNYTLRLDMNRQLAGNDGLPDTIGVLQNAGRLEIWVKSGPSGIPHLYYADTAANIASVIIRGSSDDETINVDASVGLVVTVDGGFGFDVLHGPDLATNYTFTGLDSGTGDTATTDLQFTGVEFLSGGAANDNFAFLPGGAITGDIDGGGGFDTVDFSGFTSTAVQLTGVGAIDGVNGKISGADPIGGLFNNINAVVGSKFGTTDELTGFNFASTWTQTGSGGIYVDSATGQSLQYANFEGLNAGSGSDVFNIRSTTGPLTLRGNGGNDIFNVASDAPVNAGTIGSLGGVLAIEGGAGSDTVSVKGTAGNDMVTASIVGAGTGSLGGLAQPIPVSAVETVLFDGSAGQNALAIEDRTNGAYGTPSNPGAGISYAVTGPGSGLLQIPGIISIGGFSINSGVTLNGDPDGSGDRDVLLVLGTNAPGSQSLFGGAAFGDGRDSFVISDTGISVSTVAGVPLASITNAFTGGLSTFSTIYVATGAETGQVGDEVTVVPSARVNMIVDGQSPGRTTIPGDRITISSASPGTTQLVNDPALGPVHFRFTESFGSGSVGFLNFEAGSPQAAGSGMIAVASDAGTETMIQVYDTLSGTFRYQVTPFPGFFGGASVASGDINGDGIADLIAGAGPGGAPRVAIFNGIDGSLIRDFFGYEDTFRGGVNVAASDVDGDGISEIILGTGVGGGPRVRILNGTDFRPLRDVFAYNADFRGGVNVAAGDVNGDGFADIVTSTGSGGGPRVVVLDGPTLNQLASFFVFDPNSRTGFNAAVGDVNGDGFGDIVVGAGPDGPAEIRVFSGVNRSLLSNFFVNDPFDPSLVPSIPFDAGVRVAVADVNGDRIGDIITVKGPGSLPVVRVYQVGAVNPQTNALFTTLEEIRRQDVFDGAFGFGLFVGASD